MHRRLRFIVRADVVTVVTFQDNVNYGYIYFSFINIFITREIKSLKIRAE